jgi:hypothetical protein
MSKRFLTSHRSSWFTSYSTPIDPLCFTSKHASIISNKTQIWSINSDLRICSVRIRKQRKAGNDRAFIHPPSMLRFWRSGISIAVNSTTERPTSEDLEEIHNCSLGSRNAHVIDAWDETQEMILTACPRLQSQRLFVFLITMQLSINELQRVHTESG